MKGAQELYTVIKALPMKNCWIKMVLSRNINEIYNSWQLKYLQMQKIVHPLCFMKYF